MASTSSAGSEAFNSFSFFSAFNLLSFLSLLEAKTPRLGLRLRLLHFSHLLLLHARASLSAPLPCAPILLKEAAAWHHFSSSGHFSSFVSSPYMHFQAEHRLRKASMCS